MEEIIFGILILYFMPNILIAGLLILLQGITFKELLRYLFLGWILVLKDIENEIND